MEPICLSIILPNFGETLTGMNQTLGKRLRSPPWHCDFRARPWTTSCLMSNSDELALAHGYVGSCATNLANRRSFRIGSLLSLKETRALRAITKEVVGIRAVLTHPLFGGGIPRKLLLRVSLARPTSAPLRFG